MNDSSDTKNYMSYDEAKRFAQSKEESSRAWNCCISTFIVASFLVANSSAISHYPAFKKDLLMKMEPVAAFTGLGQNWNLFSEPRKLNFHTTYVVRYDNGVLSQKEFPRFEKASQTKKFEKYKLRQLYCNYLVNPIGRKYRPQIARYLVQSGSSSQLQPVKISFDFYMDIMADPTKYGIEKRGSEKKHRDKSTIFVYRIR